jgi:hypothetical protein
MLNKLQKAIFCALILPTSIAFAEPELTLKQWRRAAAIEQALILIAEKNVALKKAGQAEYIYEKNSLEIAALLSNEVDLNVLTSVAHSALFFYGGGSTDFRMIDNVIEASYDVSILRIEKIGTLEALGALQNFRKTELLQGAYVITIEEAMHRLKIKLMH